MEVKGTSGGDSKFFMTRKEHHQAGCDPQFELALVTDALVSPKAQWFTGAELLQAFDFETHQYSVKRKR